MIYSSGTTGRPKGVLLSQRALANHAANLAPAFPFADGDANLVAMPLFHVGGIGYALFGIRAGVPTIMTREPDAAALIEAVRAGATHAFFVPPVIARFLDAGETASATDRGPALHRVRGRPHAVAIAAPSARDVARHELRPGVRTNGTVRGGHGAQ